MTKYLIILFHFVSISKIYTQIPEGNPNCENSDQIETSVIEGENIYLIGNAALSPIRKNPFVACIDTNGNLKWQNVLGRKYEGEAESIMVDSSFIYLINQYKLKDYETFRVTKHDKRDGTLIWDSTFFKGPFRNMINKSLSFINHGLQRKNDSTIVVLLQNRLANVRKSFFININSNTGAVIKTDTLPGTINSFLLDKDTIYFHSADSFCKIRYDNEKLKIWSTPILNTINSIIHKGRIKTYKKSIVISNTQGFSNGITQRINKSNGQIIWQAAATSGRILTQEIKDDYLYIVRNPNSTGGGSYWITASKIYLKTGEVIWNASHLVPESSGSHFSYDFKINDSLLIITGYNPTHVYTGYDTKAAWFIIGFNTSTGEETFFTKINNFKDYEKYSRGKSIHLLPNYIISLGNLQDSTQDNEETFYPKQGIYLIKSKYNGEIIEKRKVTIGTSPIPDFSFNDTIVCKNSELNYSIDLDSNYHPNWYVNKVLIDSGNSAKIKVKSPFYTELIIKSKFKSCFKKIDWDIELPYLDTGVTKHTNSLEALGFGEFEWLDCNASFVEIPNENHYIFDIINDGSYALKVSEKNCSDTSKCFDFLITNSNLINKDKIFIEVDRAQHIKINSNLSIQKVCIYNSIGKITHNYKNSFNSRKKVNNGINYIQITFNNGKVINKKISTLSLGKF